MRNPIRRYAIAIAALLIVFCIVVFAPSHKQDIRNSFVNIVKISRTVYLPIVINLPRLPYGVEVDGDTYPDDDYLVFDDVKQFYVNGSALKVSIHWQYDNWSLDEINNKINGWNGNGALVVTLKGVDCHPPTRDQWQDYVDFANTIVGSYPVMYLELWNEPDTSNDNFPYHFGCWGDTYQEGVYYGDFVEYVSGALTNDRVVVLAGAFHALYSPFVDGALSVVNSVDRVDMISFHCHPNDNNGCGNWLSLIDAKTDRPLFLSEYSRICDHSGCDNFLFEQSQVDLWNWAVSESRLSGAIWYSLAHNDWMHSAMVAGCAPWDGGACVPRAVHGVYVNYFAP